MTRQIHTRNPAGLLEAAFRRIHAERMTGLPILNPRLAVEAVEFQDWQGHWLGVLVTPWFMNLMLLPGEGSGWQGAPSGGAVHWRFPIGELRFIADLEPGLGEFQSSPLFSPMHRFADPEHARRTAGEALDVLLDQVVNTPAAPQPAADPGRGPGQRWESGWDEEQAVALTKRDFLRRMLLRDDPM